MKIETRTNTLYWGDCLDIMPRIPAGSVDLVLTDPPYGMSYQSSRRTDTHSKIANDDNLNWLPTLLRESYRVLKDNTAAFFFCSWHNIEIFKKEIGGVFEVKNILVWDKGVHGLGDLKGNFASRVEFCFLAVKGRPLLTSKRPVNLIKEMRTRNNLHPTQKPVPLMEKLISPFTSRGCVVLDPFTGSGSTGVACANTDRKFIGIEMDPKYFSIASDRILEAANHDK